MPTRHTWQVRAPKNGGLGYWDPTVAFNFGKAVIDWLIAQLQGRQGGARLVMRYDPSAGAISLVEMPTESGDEPSAKRPRA